MTETTSIRARYWAAARAASGCEYDDVEVTKALTLRDLVGRLDDLHSDRRLAEILAGCSVLLGDQPVSSREADDVAIPPGSTVEFLPPFAGG